MIYAEKTIKREDMTIHYVVHDSICAICAHNRNRYLACRGLNKNPTGKCREMDDAITECFEFKKYA